MRCLKCSNPLVRSKFFAKEVLNQLKYTGMLDTLKIRRAGFALRRTHQQFMDDYHVLDVNAMNHIDLVESIKNNHLPSIIRSMTEPPPANQKNADGTYDAIRVGKSLVLARDWLDRELSRLRKVIYDKSAVIIQATYRGSKYHMDYQKEQSAWSIQACLRAVAVCKPYKSLRSTTLQIMPEMHAFTGRIQQARAADSALMVGAQNEMAGFLEDNKRLERAEAEERKSAAMEDDYSWKLMDATFAERVNADKQQYIAMAECAYSSATGQMKAVKEFLDGTSRKGAEADARWQKMQTEGVVRTVPVVRQYKAADSPFTAPAADSFRFKYTFSYKGAKAAKADAETPNVGK